MKLKTLLLAAILVFTANNLTSAAFLDETVDATNSPQNIFLDEDWNGNHNYQNGRHRGGHYEDDYDGNHNYRNGRHHGGYDNDNY